MMPLGMANVGDVNIIKKINGRDEVRQHLAELGFVVGTEVTVVSELGGNLILHVKESRIGVETSADQVRIELEKWAISSNETATEAAKAEAKKAQEAKAKAKAAKKADKAKKD